MTCQSCTAPTSNGLDLCDLCQRKAILDLEFLPIYFRNLSRWRPGRAGSRPVPGSRVLYDGEVRGPGTGDRISDTLDETASALTAWARKLADERPHVARLLDRLAAARDAGTVDEAQAVAWLCAGFYRYLLSIATLDWCADFVHELGYREQMLRGITEVSVPGWYAGACGRKISMEGGTCGAGTYVVPGLTWVTCHACGTTTYARDHLEVVLNEARGWVAQPMRLAEALVALVDTEMSVPRLHKRISKWGERDQIETMRRLDSDGDPFGPKRFRLGDVVDLLFAEGQTRLTEKSCQTDMRSATLVAVGEVSAYPNPGDADA